MHDAREYLKLAKAIKEAPYAPPCMVTDPELWFASHEDEWQVPRVAKKFCSECPVRAECLTYALAVNEPFGIWGGLTPKERSALRGQGRGPGSGKRRRNQNRRLDSPQERPEQPQSQT